MLFPQRLQHITRDKIVIRVKKEFRKIQMIYNAVIDNLCVESE